MFKTVNYTRNMEFAGYSCPDCGSDQFEWNEEDENQKIS
jgi:hypothetical protein